MKAIWAALKDFCLSVIVKINFTDIIMGAVSGFGGFFGKIISLFARPILSRVEKSVDEKITGMQETEKSDQAIDEAAQSHLNKINQAQTDDDLYEAARDSLR